MEELGVACPRMYLLYYVRFRLPGHNIMSRIYLPTLDDAKDLLWTLQLFMNTFDMGFFGGEYDKQIYSETLAHIDDSLVQSVTIINYFYFIKKTKQIQEYKCKRRDCENSSFEYDKYTKCILNICGFKERQKIKTFFGTKIIEI